VLGEMKEEFTQLLAKKNVQYLFSVPDGRYRYFSKGPIRTVADLKKHRFWLWPASYISKELLREAGASAVPLGANDVYGALQTGMIDAITSTAPSAVALRWHTKLDHVTTEGAGVLEFHFLVNKAKWDALPATVKASIIKHIPEAKAEANRGKKADLDTLNKLIARGYTGVKVTPEARAEWVKFFERVRARLVGRVFPASLLQKVMAIAARAPKT